MPTYTQCRICDREFPIDRDIRWHRVHACCKEHYEVIVGRKAGPPSAVRAHQEQIDRAAEAEVAMLSEVEARKAAVAAQVNARDFAEIIVPADDSPEAEKAAREKAGDDMRTMTGIGNVREYHGGVHRRGLVKLGAVLLLSLVGQAWATSPATEPLRDRVDAFEVNSFYDEQGRLVFVQLIGWDWYSDTNSQHVVFWRLVKSPALRPVFDHSRRDWSVNWLDGEAFREVRADSFVETWSQFDPEREDLAAFPQERRRGLQIEPSPFREAKETA